MRITLSCDTHAAATAAFECPSCRSHLCETECSKRIWAAGGFVHQCVRCDAMLRPLDQDEVTPVAPGPRAFLDRLPELLMYPVRQSTLLTLLGLALITTPLRWGVSQTKLHGLAVLGIILIEALQAAIYFRLVSQTAHGDEDASPPDISEIWSDLIAPLFLYAAALLPILAGFAWMSDQIGSAEYAAHMLLTRPAAMWAHKGPLVLIVFGLFMLPLFTAIAALSRSPAPVLLPSVWKRFGEIMGGTYAVASAAFFCVLALEVLVWLPFMSYLRAEHSLPMITAVITTALAYLPMALRARLLGGMIEPYNHRLS